MSTQHRAFILLAVAANCWFNTSIASSQNLTSDWVENTAAPLVKNQTVDGLSIGYIEGNNFGIVHLGSSGATKKKANYKTLYEIGSITKVFTSLLLADAVVRGDIDLNAPAVDANHAGMQLPSHNGRQIKWLDLSTHRSGMPKLPANFHATDLMNPYRSYDSTKAAAFLAQYKLPRPPGESQVYSNLGPSVLGYLLAQQAGLSYDELLRERIAKPLGMTDCAVTQNSEQKQRLATPHESYGTPTLPWTFADLPGAGGIRATMRDMMRFAKAQLTPPAGTLGEAIELAWQQHTAADSSGSAMGLGWMILDDDQTHWHNGGTGGSTSAIYINRELQCAVIVLCNTSVRNTAEPLAMQLLAKATGQNLGPEPSDKSAKNTANLAIDEHLRSRLEGRYQLAPDFIFTVRDRDGHLMVNATNQPTLEVTPDSPTHWSNAQVGATLEFTLAKTGPATSLILHQGGAEQTAPRMEDEVEADDPSDDLAIDAKLRRRLVGRYQMTPTFILDVRDSDGQLTVTATNQSTLKLTPDSPTRWSNAQVKATLEFKLPKTGVARSLVLHQNGGEQIARRIKSDTTDNNSDDLAIDAKLRRRLVGRYQLKPDFIFTVKDRDGHLMVGITNQSTQEVFPDSPTRWSYRSVDAALEFKLPKTGRAKSLVLHQNGNAQTAQRIR